MSQSDLSKYITAARRQGHSDHQIQSDLTAGGWDADVVKTALARETPVPLPAPPRPSATSIPATDSTRSFDYIISFIALGVSAAALIALLQAMVAALFVSNRSLSNPESAAPFALAALIVFAPVLVFLARRLYKAEQEQPELRNITARRWGVQLSLVASLLAGLGSIVSFLYTAMAGSNSNSVRMPMESDVFGMYGPGMMQPISVNTHPVAIAFWSTIITLAIAGGIFYYFWKDQHGSR